VYREILRLTRKFYGDDHPRLAQSLGNLANHFLSCGQEADAEKLLRETVALQRKYLGTQHPALRISLFQIGFILKERGQLADAEPFLREALAIARAADGRDYNTSVLLKDLAQIVLVGGKPQEAEGLARESTAIREKIFPPGSWYIENARSIVGDALLAQKRYNEAEPLMVASFVGLKESEPRPLSVATCKVRVRAAKSLVTLYREMNRPLQAAEWQQVLDQAESELGVLQAAGTPQATPSIVAPNLPRE
jgi:tetratricopeptide (TPR) repeat protein